MSGVSSSSPQVEAFFDPATATISYVLFDPEAGACAVIDPVLDYEPHAARTATTSADRIAAFVHAHGLRVAWLLETHVHADHLSASKHLQRQLGGRIGIGEAIGQVDRAFQRLFGSPDAAPARGSPFDQLFAPDERFAVGGLRLRTMHVPGHTPADMAYVVEDAQGQPCMAFVGDTLFMPDVGSARCDFPGGDARSLYRSARALLALPPRTRLFMCHDYPPAGREARWESSVAAQRRDNIHLRDGIGEAAFIALREGRDRQLGLPRLILPSIQVNLRAGELPPAEANGVRYLRVPIDQM